jgi:hypothetical protein
MKTCVPLAGLPLVLSLTTAISVSAQATRKPPEQLGRVSFANSCSNDVQPGFERAVALLHSFWWQEGEKAFRDDSPGSDGAIRVAFKRAQTNPRM